MPSRSARRDDLDALVGIIRVVDGQPWLVAVMLVVAQAVSVIGGFLGRPVKDESEADTGTVSEADGR